MNCVQTAVYLIHQQISRREQSGCSVWRWSPNHSPPSAVSCWESFVVNSSGKLDDMQLCRAAIFSEWLLASLIVFVWNLKSGDFKLKP